MPTYVPSKVRKLTERFPAYAAHVRLYLVMHSSCVVAEMAAAVETFIALVAFVKLYFAVNEFVATQACPSRKLFAANIAFERLLIGVRSFVLSKAAMVISGIWTQQTSMFLLNRSIRVFATNMSRKRCFISKKSVAFRAGEERFCKNTTISK